MDLYIHASRLSSFLALSSPKSHPQLEMVDTMCQHCISQRQAGQNTMPDNAPLSLEVTLKPTLLAAAKIYRQARIPRKKGDY